MQFYLNFVNIYFTDTVPFNKVQELSSLKNFFVTFKQIICITTL